MFIAILTSLTKSGEKIYFQKRLEKACEIRKCCLLLHPAKHAEFLDRLIRKREEKRKQKFSKKLQKVLAG